MRKAEWWSWTCFNVNKGSLDKKQKLVTLEMWDWVYHEEVAAGDTNHADIREGLEDVFQGGGGERENLLRRVYRHTLLDRLRTTRKTIILQTLSFHIYLLSPFHFVSPPLRRIKLIKQHRKLQSLTPQTFLQSNYPRNEYQLHPLNHTHLYPQTHARTCTKRKPYAKQRSGLTKQRPDDVTHKPPMGRQLWKRLSAERVNVFQTVLSNTHTDTTHTQRHTSAGAATKKRGLFCNGHPL